MPDDAARSGDHPDRDEATPLRALADKRSSTGDPKPFDLTPRRSTRSMVLLALGVTAVLALLVAGAVVFWADKQFEQIPTFAERAPGWIDATTFPPSDTAAPTPDSIPPVQDITKDIDGPPPSKPPVKRGVTFLIFSTGSENLSAADAQRLNIPPDRATHRDGLTDSIMLVVVDPDSGQVGILSIPRDLWVPQIKDRINTVYIRQGPRALALTVGRMTGLPIDHMIAVNFSAFGELTDSVGGIDLWVDGPARDPNTGFEVKGSGCVHMDGAIALAFARSRHWEVPDGNGGWRPDASSSDFGRIKRQQMLVRAALKKLATPLGLPLVNSAVGVAQRHLTVDRDLDFRKFTGIALNMLSNPSTAIHTFSYAGTPGWAGAASVVFTDSRANAAPISALQRLLIGEPVDARAGGQPASPAAGPDPAAPNRSC